MPKPTAEEIRDRARAAAVESGPPASVGDFIGFVDETENVITMKFASRQKGYVGWVWHVSMFVSDDEMTVSEVNLLSGENSLVAPDWVPWADRLADYKALQAALEAEAAEVAAENDEDSEDDSDADTDNFEADNEPGDDELETSETAEVAVDSIESAEIESAVALEENGDEAETDSNDAGKRPPRFLRRRLGRLKKKK